MKQITENVNSQDDSRIELPSTYRYDRIVIVLVTLAGFGVCLIFDVFEMMAQVTRGMEPSQIDELIPSLFILVLSLAWYSRRRRKELEKNIEKQKQLEIRLKTLNLTLEEKIKDRTRELVAINAELKEEVRRRNEAEAKKIEAEKLNSIVEMSGTICHELNQPLQSISGNTELILMNPPEDPALLKRVSTIKTQVDRMSAIIKKLLTVTRYQTKNYPGDSKIIDID